MHQESNSGRTPFLLGPALSFPREVSVCNEVLINRSGFTVVEESGN